jgi:putative spermidine/putrescine transport system ATP-binding protein
LSYLELQHLNKSFDGVTAVHDFDLTVDKGEFVSLLGPSGCGKTTTLRMIVGFESPDSGFVRLGGEAMNELPPHRRGMGMVFQMYALFPNMTAWGNIAYGLRVAGLPRSDIEERVTEMLELVNLSEAAQKYPTELSGGQQQRVALARALAIRPRVLLLDEPLSALDAVVRVSLRQEIRRIQSALGITTVYVTHDQEEALSISDRVVVMQRGAIEQVGTPEEIYSRPLTNFVATFIGTVNQFEGVLEDPPKGRVNSGGMLINVLPVTDGRFMPGDLVTVLVRPESIHVSPLEEGTESDNVNRTQARLEGVTFLGPVTRFSMDRDGQTITADVSTQERGRFKRGQSLMLSFPPEACQLMQSPGRPPGPSTGQIS